MTAGEYATAMKDATYYSENAYIVPADIHDCITADEVFNKPPIYKHAYKFYPHTLKIMLTVTLVTDVF
jgi:hypothetical protein